MLEFTALDKKKTTNSNESFIGSIIIALLAGIVFASAYWFEYRRQRKKAKETRKVNDEIRLQKYTEFLIQNYPKICQYINTELKDDPFFFKDSNKKLNVDHAIICVKDRIELAKKLLQIPEPTSDDTSNSYYDKLSKYIKTHDVKVKHQELRDNYCESDDTYYSNQWLNSEKVVRLFKYTEECKKIDDQVIRKLDAMCDINLKDKSESVGSQFDPGTVGNVFELIFDYDDTYRCGSKSVPDTWDRLVGWYGITQELKKIATHIKSKLREETKNVKATKS